MTTANKHNDVLLFSEELSPAEVSGRSWKILLVDDDRSVHDVTRLALSDFQFADRGLEFVSAYSGSEAKQAIADHPDTALVLLDVVMESETAGLEVAQYIREVVNNKAVRIVLRTGQPGQAPERDVIAQYDINDYKEKTELTSRKLSTLLYASLRSYKDIIELEKNKRGLEAVIEASARIFELKSLDHFTDGVLEQLSSLLQSICETPDCHTEALAAARDDGDFRVTSALGVYRQLVGKKISALAARELQDALGAARTNAASRLTDDSYTGLIHDQAGVKRLLFINGLCGAPTDIDRSLMHLFERNVSIAFENVDLLQEIEQTQREMVYILGETIETRSNETGHHVKRVAEISKLIALEYGLSEEEAEIIRIASPLHDIGKIGIPDAILNKPGKLTAEEWDIMTTHTTLGHDMLKSSRRKALQAGAIIALDHHEKWSGGGYPNNKSGEEIHLYGRITAVADVFDALGSERCYKHAWPLEDILDLMRRERGQHFQQELVDILLDNIDRVTEICRENSD